MQQVLTLAIVAFGFTIAMAAGDFDLSVGSVTGLAGIIGTGLLVNGYHFFSAIAIALLIGALFGSINGVISTKLGIPSLISLYLGLHRLPLELTLCIPKAEPSTEVLPNLLHTWSW